MALEITVDERQLVHHIGAPFSARLSEFGAPGGPNEAIGRIYGWLESHRVAPLGGPLYVYQRFGGPDEPVDVTVAVPISAPVTPSDGLVLGTLPAGTYVVGRHTGAPDSIGTAYDDVRAWAAEHGHRLVERREGIAGSWSGHAEQFLTDPAEEPDASRWVTELLFATT